MVWTLHSPQEWGRRQAFQENPNIEEDGANLIGINVSSETDVQNNDEMVVIITMMLTLCEAFLRSCYTY